MTTCFTLNQELNWNITNFCMRYLSAISYAVSPQQSLYVLYHVNNVILVLVFATDTLHISTSSTELLILHHMLRSNHGHLAWQATEDALTILPLNTHEHHFVLDKAHVQNNNKTFWDLKSKKDIK